MAAVPRLDVPAPMDDSPKVAAYWQKIQENDIAAKVIAEMNRETMMVIRS